MPNSAANPHPDGRIVTIRREQPTPAVRLSETGRQAQPRVLADSTKQSSSFHVALHRRSGPSRSNCTGSLQAGDLHPILHPIWTYPRAPTKLLRMLAMLQ